MKKRIVCVGAAAVMALSLMTGCSSNNAKETSSNETSTSETSNEETSEGEYQFVTAAETVEIAKSGDGHVLDVREWDNYVEGRIADSEWCPIFPLEEEDLADEMADYAKANLSDGEKIYIVCNSGQRGAQKTTEVLIDAGIDEALIYTVEGGAKALADEKDALTTDRSEENIDWQYISGEEVLDLDDIQIVDVRDDENYDEGHLADSIHQDVTDFESTDLQTAMYNLGTDTLNSDEPVYFLCYSGNKCAKTAISVLKDAGFDTSKLFIIEDGAKDSAIQGALVK